MMVIERFYFSTEGTYKSNISQKNTITDGLWTSAFVMRKKGCYHKNRPFRLLVAAALRFVQSYLNDIAPDAGVSSL